jgi:hypothetical protein
LAPTQLPEAPQYPRFVEGSMQTSPQLIWLPAHETRQMLLLHTCPAAHCVPSLVPSQLP